MKLPVAKSFQFVRTRARTGEGVVMTDLRFRIRTQPTESDIKRVGAVGRKCYEGREMPPTNRLQGRVLEGRVLCASLTEGGLVK